MIDGFDGFRDRFSAIRLIKVSAGNFIMIIFTCKRTIDAATK